MEKWMAIMMIGMFGSMFAGIAFEKHSEAQVQIACYEAAKTNHNITCNKTEKEKK